MKKRRFLIVALLLAGLMAVSTSGTAGVEEAGFVLKAADGMKDVLAQYTGKKVALRLESGEEIEGTVTMVGNSLVHISKLTGKEFYDAVVSIDRISAVQMRVR